MVNFFWHLDGEDSIPVRARPVDSQPGRYYVEFRQDGVELIIFAPAETLKALGAKIIDGVLAAEKAGANK